MKLFFSNLLLRKREDKIISPKMRDDRMDFWLMWVGFGILEFSRQNKSIRGKQLVIEYAIPEDQYQYR